jgi:hypothetical protein
MILCKDNPICHGLDLIQFFTFLFACNERGILFTRISILYFFLMFFGNSCVFARNESDILFAHISILQLHIDKMYLLDKKKTFVCCGLAACPPPPPLLGDRMRPAWHAGHSKSRIAT